MKKNIFLAITALSLLASLPACNNNKGRPALPDVYPGWHNGDYSVVSGRLHRIPSRDPSELPTWVIRYGMTTTDDSYGGELALMPPEALVGYSGGEFVQIRGQIDEAYKSPNYPGTFYNIRRINIWNNGEDK